MRPASASLGPCGLALIAALGLACRPDTTSTPPAPTASTTTDPAAEVAPTVATEPDQLAPHRCEITIDLLAPGGVTGKGSSAKSNQEAKDEAWAEACAKLREEQDLDCHAESVAIRQEGTGTIQSKKGSGELQQSYRHTVTLTTQRRATGRGESTEDRHSACRAAKEDACRTLGDQPCTTDDVRVVEVDGRPPGSPRPKPASAQTM